MQEGQRTLYLTIAVLAGSFAGLYFGKLPLADFKDLVLYALGMWTVREGVTKGVSVFTKSPSQPAGVDTKPGD